MNRREELENEMMLIQGYIDKAPDTIPEYVIMDWEKVISNLSFELNNLYDTNETEQPD